MRSAGAIRYGRKASATSAMPKPARPITKLAAVMTAAAAIHASVTAAAVSRASVTAASTTTGRTAAGRRSAGAGTAPRASRKAAMPRGRRRNWPVQNMATRVSAVRLPRMVGAQELPHHLPRQRDGDRGRALGDLARQLRARSASSASGATTRD